MYLLKGCTKCEGDLVFNSDHYGDYISCMQCGRCQDLGVAEPQAGVVFLQTEEMAVASVPGGAIKKVLGTTVGSPSSARVLAASAA